jgi:hypothetical protein
MYFIPCASLVNRTAEVRIDSDLEFIEDWPPIASSYYRFQAMRFKTTAFQATTAILTN